MLCTSLNLLGIFLMSVKKKIKKTETKKTVKKPAKKTVSKKTAVKKIVAKKTVGKKTSSKKATPKKVTPKKVTPKKASPTKASSKKASSKKASSKKASPKKASPKKASSKKVTPKKMPIKKVIEKKIINKKDEFFPEQYVVYPSHGIGQILEIEKKEIAGQFLTMYVIEFEKEKMTLRVPIEKTKEIGVRKVSTRNQLKEIFDILTGKAKIRRTMWSRRAQEYEAKINSGDIKLLTEVVRDLFRSDSQPEQSYSERQLYEAARERLSREVAVIEKTDEQKAIEKMETILNNSNPRSEELNSED